MTAENNIISPQAIDVIVEAMVGETTQQMVARRLREEGVFSHLKLYEEPLPKLPEESGLKVVNSGLMFDFGEQGMVDSFIVYNPKRVEVRIQSEAEKPTIRRGRQSTAERQDRWRIMQESEGWITPFPKSRGRVVSYRPVNQGQGKS